MAKREVVPIRCEEDLIIARRRTRELAQRLGFGTVDQSRIATAVSELVRNVVQYATDSRGELEVYPVRSPTGSAGLEIVVRDGGPGIPDVERAMTAGYTTGGGWGMGLPGTRCLMDEMEVRSAPDGTTVTIRKWTR